MNNKNTRPPPLDPVGGFYASLRNLSQIVVMLQERLDDVLGLKESLAVWRRNSLVDEQLRSQLKGKIDEIIKTLPSDKEKAEFLREKLFDYYTRRMTLAKALSKVSVLKPTANGFTVMLKPDDENSPETKVVITRDVVSEIRKCLAELSDIHVLLSNILKGTVVSEAVEDQSMCDDQYLASLAGDLSASQSGMFVNAYSRFEAIMDEIESAERQVQKLEDRAASYSHTDEAEKDKVLLKEMEEKLASFMESPEAKEAVEKLARMKDMRKRHMAPGGARYAAATKAIAEQEKLVASFLETPDALSVKAMIKEQRKRVYAHRKSPEALAASALVGKRKKALEILELRLEAEAKQFCAMRDKILKAVEQAYSNISTRCHALPERVRDVFRINPPKVAENIVSINDHLSYRK